MTMAILRNPTADRWDLDKGIAYWHLGACFPRRITFADVDSETEINGYYLVIEGKREHERLAGGQLFTMRARVRDGRTCLIIYGDPPYGVRKMQHFKGDPSAGVIDATLVDVHDFCASWGRWAESQPHPPRRASTFTWSKP